MPNSRKNLLVTGRPGVGKTTLIRKVLDGLDVRAGGFYTSEIRENGKRVGFAITDLAGGSGVLAHVAIASEFRVGRYGVNKDDIEAIGVPAIDDAVLRSDLVVMDEVGRMELCSDAFQAAVMRALDSRTPVLGTIQDRRNPFLDAVRARTDVKIVRITEANRDEAKRAVLRLVSSVLGERRRD